MIDEKQKFIIPVFEIIKFQDEDIITLSLGGTIGDGGDNEEPFEEN